MLPSSSRVMDVAYPYASPPLHQTLRFQSGLARIAPDGEEERQDHGDDQKSRVRKMGVFLAGTAAAAAASYSYGEIRKRSLMEDKAPSLDDLSKGQDESVVSRLGFPPMVRAATTFSGEPPPSEMTKDDSAGSSGGKGLTRRQRFNFISEVVEETAAALVYIEIKDMGVRDYMSGEPMTRSNGSGFIIDPEGLILTNAHVVINKPRAKVQVRLQDGRTFQGHVEDVDVRSDLATVRIDARDLPVMRLGQSSSVRPGEFVIAMGSPLSLSNTITTGIVSSCGRNRSELGLRGRDVPEYIQTDAAITFGNSGGPLINLDGEAIGINSMKVTHGISFAIPIDYAKEFLQKSLESKKNDDVYNDSGKRDKKKCSVPPHRRYMGISMLALTEQNIDELRAKLHIPSIVSHGVLVFRILDQSPADRSGVKPGDIVTHINESPITGVADVYKFLDGQDALQLTLIRKNQVINVVVTPEL